MRRGGDPHAHTHTNPAVAHREGGGGCTHTHTNKSVVGTVLNHTHKAIEILFVRSIETHTHTFKETQGVYTARCSWGGSLGDKVDTGQPSGLSRALSSNAI